MADKKVRRRVVLAAGFGGVLAVGMAAGAWAASLGGSTSTGLGAEDVDVVSCDTDGVALSYTYVYDAAAKHYKVTAVNVAGVAAACVGKAASVSLRDDTVALSTDTTTAASPAFAFTLASPVEASRIDGVSLLITG